MNIPNLDPGGGPLSIAEVFIDYEGPQLFAVRNKGGARFLALHTVPEKRSDRWLYVRISAQRLRHLARGLMPIRDAFERPEYGSIALYSIREGDFQDDIRWLAAAALDVSLLPDRDSFIEKDQLVTDEVRDIALQSAPEDVRSVIRRAEQPLWELDPKVIEVLSAYRTPPHVTANATKRSVVDLAFSVDKSRTDFPIRSLSSVLGVTQSLVDALAVEDAELGSRGPIPAWARGQTALDAVATFPSSFGIRIETNVGDMVGNTAVELALQRLVYLLDAAASANELREALRKVSRRAQNHFRAFSTAVASGRADFRVEVATPGQEATHRVYLSETRVRWLAQYLSKEVEALEREFSFTGRLLGVSLKTRFFLMQSDEQEISGRIARECLKKIDEKKINVVHHARILERTEVSEATGEETQRYTLTDIEEAS